MAKGSSPVAEPNELSVIEALEKRIDKIERKCKRYEDIFALFGRYYNTEGVGSFFILDAILQGGASGVALSPRQGLVEQFSLPIKAARPDSERERPCLVPLFIPEAAEEALELFDADGADNKASD